MRQVIEGRRTLAGVLAVALLMCGCTTSHPLNADPSQVRDLGRDEGIVFGSLLVEIATDVEKSESFWQKVLDGRPGPQATDFSYRLTMPGPRPEIDLSLSREEWELLVSPGEEHTFVARLPSGLQYVGGLQAVYKSFWQTSQGEYDIVASFRVTSGEVTYIGRLVLVLPERLSDYSKAHVRVEDGLAAAQAELGDDYGERFESPRVELMDVEHGRITTFKPTVRTPPSNVP
jgi:hypothetical protein